MLANPVATRFTQPGEIVPVNVSGKCIDLGECLHNLDQCGRIGAIVGPHGSGKTTVLSRIYDEALRGNHSVTRYSLRNTTWQDLQRVARILLQSKPDDLLLLDSWERMSRTVGSVVCRLAVSRGCRLVVTSHRVMSIPVLMTCQVSLKSFLAIIKQLPNSRLWLGSLIMQKDIETAFESYQPNLREALFRLYDVFEDRSRQAMQSGRMGYIDRSGC